MSSAAVVIGAPRVMIMARCDILLNISAIGIVAAGRIHSGFVKPGMSITFGPTELKTKVCVTALPSRDTIQKTVIFETTLS